MYHQVYSRQDGLNTCLALAITSGSMKMIKFLLHLEPKLELHSLYAAIKREDPSLFELLVNAGWNVDSNESRCPVVQ
jgi:hypothetical protein